MSLKAELAEYANSIYRHLWFESSLKDKIVLGKHSLDCSEKTRLARYTDRINNRYDGVHMYGEAGRIAYTDSVLAILSSVIVKQSPRLRPRVDNSHNDCPQTNFMKAQETKPVSQFSVPVQNRYNLLGN